MKIQYTQPVNECCQAANRGQTGAQYEMGLRCLRGDEVERNLQDAIAWLEKAANGGNIDAQWHLGMIFFGGMGGTKDPARAVQWLQRAADRGHAESGGRLGMAYLFGDGVSENTVLAWKYLRLAEGIGHPVYDWLLGAGYLDPTFGQPDVPKATVLLKSAARSGVIGAQVALAAVMCDGATGNEDRVVSLAWATLAASRGATQAEPIRDYLEGLMNLELIEQARSRARQWHKEIPVVRMP